MVEVAGSVASVETSICGSAAPWRFAVTEAEILMDVDRHLSYCVGRDEHWQVSGCYALLPHSIVSDCDLEVGTRER